MTAVYDAAEKVSRSKFSSLLDPRNCPETNQPSYFSGENLVRDAADREDRELYPYSVFVVYKFASWQIEEEDILDQDAALLSANAINRRFSGARIFIGQLANQGH